MEKCIVLFRRDLRIVDNTALTRARLDGKHIIPVFIFTPEQVHNNKFKSSNSIQFMVNSLLDLNEQINNIHSNAGLFAMYGDNIDILDQLYDKYKYTSLYLNCDYTPYSEKRDNNIHKFCKKRKIVFNSFHDILLLDTQDIVSGNDTHYKVFGQFYKKTIDSEIRKPIKNTDFHFIKLDKKNSIKNMNKFLLNQYYYQINDNIIINGGRSEGLKLLSSASKFSNYKLIRNDMTKHTSMLSAHNKFGTISIREVYYSFIKHNQKDMIQQLFWRDFYYYVCHHFPHVLDHQHINKPNKHKVDWENNKSFLKKWKEGRTGFPIVDASMTEMNITGYMHNRGRMIVSNFLAKDLLVDWKYGEQYFSQKLVDIDRCQNCGNWNWSTSFGLDAAPYPRIFNPWTQSKDYDSEAKYIKKWLPELADIPPKHIHEWYKYCSEYDIDYPHPIVDHSTRRNMFLEFFKKNYTK